ncbi:MAG: ABC transporter ATP-binding protein/permease [Actinobacteria bacterium]|nr:ABC transporter ATP-binding protein/permease [Actinomycetota bacterium]
MSLLTHREGLTGRLRGLSASPRVKLARLLPVVSVPLTVGVTAATLLVAVMGPLTAVARGFLVGSIPATLSQGGLASDAGGRTLLALGLVAAVFIAQLLVRNVHSVLGQALGIAVDHHLEARLIRLFGRPPGLSHLEDPSMADRIAQFQGVGSAGYRPGNAVPGLAGRVATWLSGLGSAILLAGFRWWVAVGLSAVFLWAARVTLRDYLTLTKILTGQAPTLRRSYYYRDLAFLPAPAKEVRVFGLGTWLVSHFRSFWFDAMGPLWEERRNPWPLGLASLAMGISSIAAAAYVGFSALNGELDIGQVAVFLGAIAGLYAFGSGYGPGDLQLQYGLGALPTIQALEDDIAKQPNLRGSPAPPDVPSQGIRFEAVHFAYPGTERSVLSGTDLDIPAGKSTAIVGLNGVGKTTIIKLLCRFYDPGKGRILVDGIDVRSIDPKSWQRRIAAIFQDFVRYELSARENVEFGGIEIEGNGEKITNAVKRAGANVIIEALPNGLETPLSREVTGGVQISGGEWQRIALARAMLAIEAGAKVLILDEPTANLDVRAEAELYRSFLDMTRGLTTVLVSHRFSTIRRADLIYVIEDGKVAERGNHAELMALEGRYARMFNLQAARFADQKVQGTP